MGDGNFIGDGFTYMIRKQPVRGVLVTAYKHNHRIFLVRLLENLSKIPVKKFMFSKLHIFLSCLV